MMHRWRKMTDDERSQTLLWRERLKRPWHSVHHVDSGQRHYFISASCFNHEPHIGRSVERMNAFTEVWLAVLAENTSCVAAWVVLPNHYHALVSAKEVLVLLKALGRLHGRSSFQWNKEENTRGRQVWFNATETVIKSPEHFGAARKYAHHNPVKHGYAPKWTDWAWSSAADYLTEVGRDEAAREFGLYDVSRFGEGWDDAEM